MWRFEVLITSLILFVSLCAASAVADTGDSGLLCSTYGANCANPTQITAQNNGNITGSLYYYSADFYDWVRVIDTNPNNSWTSSWTLFNHGQNNGPVVFGSALKGDVLVVQLCDQTLQFSFCSRSSNYIYGSDPRYSVDGKSHALVNTQGGGTVSLKNSTQTWAIWMEDLDDRWKSDWDYNDEVVTISNITVSFGSSSSPEQDAPVPEPASLSLLGSGLAAWLLRKKLA